MYGAQNIYCAQILVMHKYWQYKNIDSTQLSAEHKYWQYINICRTQIMESTIEMQIIHKY